MQLTILGSGSRGNAAVIQKNGRSLLVDAGFSYRELSGRLKKNNIPIESITAVVITHEHVDHIRGLGAFVRINRIPVYLNKKTFENLYDELKEDAKNWVRFYETGSVIELNEIQVQSFPIRHDASDPVGFTFTSGEKKIGYVTDIGSITDIVIDHLSGVSLLVVEANHDLNLLMRGKYPEHLKRRISGPAGHLSNSKALEVVWRVMSDKLRAVYLSHLSKENNKPELAFRAVHDPIGEEFGTIPEICIAEQDKASEPYQL